MKIFKNRGKIFKKSWKLVKNFRKIIRYFWKKNIEQQKLKNLLKPIQYNSQFPASPKSSKRKVKKKLGRQGKLSIQITILFLNSIKCAFYGQLIISCNPYYPFSKSNFLYPLGLEKNYWYLLGKTIDNVEDFNWRIWIRDERWLCWMDDLILGIHYRLSLVWVSFKLGVENFSWYLNWSLIQISRAIDFLTFLLVLIGVEIYVYESY